jgi:hypothetical protein
MKLNFSLIVRILSTVFAFLLLTQSLTSKESGRIIDNNLRYLIVSVSKIRSDLKSLTNYITDIAINTLVSSKFDQFESALRGISGVQIRLQGNDEAQPGSTVARIPHDILSREGAGFRSGDIIVLVFRRSPSGGVEVIAATLINRNFK